MKLFNKILIANRGEIASRILRTCRKLGISTVAVYSEADAEALYVREADETIALGHSDPAQSYLNIEKIIEAARQTQVEAIHPGYGFLSENAAFAKACTDAGFEFIGPPASVIAAMGDKLTAKGLMTQNGISTLGASLKAIDEKSAPQLAAKMGYPVLLKAAAGGGGKGMRIIRHPSELRDGLAAAQREARSAFGDERIFMEKFLEHPRHIEVQIIADQQGNIEHLFERDCTVQRRHQKIIEESPSPVLSKIQREQLCALAVKAAQATEYCNVGTVEFLYEDDRFYFLEMNTRLQVEHPITEAITGTDLVHWQLRLAAGHSLGILRPPRVPRGHALELRIYAEDPSNKFLPSAGRIEALIEPSGPGIRIESSLYKGWRVPHEYDPLLSKLVVWDETRSKAIKRALKALRDYRIDGIHTNRDFLQEVLSHPDFAHNDIDTYWVERVFGDWAPSEMQGDIADLYTPWIPKGAGATSKRRQAFQREHLSVEENLANGPLSIKAPMPGKIIQIDINAGDRVKKGSRLLVLEAMKMEHSLTVPRNARVTKVYKKTGEQVAMGEILIELE